MATTFHLPTKIIFGAGTVSRLGSEASGLGKRALLVTGGSSARKSGLLDRATKDLQANGVEAFLLDKVTPNPRTSTVNEGAEMAREKDIDLIIALGGGSAMDAAKGVRLSVSGGRPVWDYHMLVVDAKVVKPTLGLMMVPTMAATGSEANNFAVLTDWETHEKRAIAVPAYFPDVSIVDPELTLTVPVGGTAKGGVDIFLHVAENYITAPERAPLTDGIREAIMKVVVNALPRALAKLDDIEARTDLSWASSVACSPFISLGGGTGYRPMHLIQHALGGYYDMPHGDGLAAVLPSWLRYMLPLRKERVEALGRNVFGDADTVAAVGKWLDKVGMKTNLKSLGVKPEEFEAIADNALRTSRGLLAKDPVPYTVESIAGIYRDAY